MNIDEVMGGVMKKIGSRLAGYLITALAISIPVLLVAGSIAWSVSFYSECRESNSVMYCLRMLAR